MHKRRDHLITENHVGFFLFSPRCSRLIVICPYHRGTGEETPHRNSILSRWLGIQAIFSIKQWFCSTQCSQVASRATPIFYISWWGSLPPTDMSDNRKKSNTFTGALTVRKRLYVLWTVSSTEALGCDINKSVWHCKGTGDRRRLFQTPAC